MKLKNTTDFTNERIREIIRFVKPAGVNNVAIEVGNSVAHKHRVGVHFDISEDDKVINVNRGHLVARKDNDFNGFSYNGRNRITCKVTQDEHRFPILVTYSKPQTRSSVGMKNGIEFVKRFSVGSKGYLDHLLLNREEALVHLLAHELRHQWQERHPKGWRVWGAKGQYSERDADAYAIRKVREWRKAVSNVN